MADQQVHMQLWRGDASGGEFKDYRITVGEGQVVLDVVHAIQAQQANDLAVRWNCKAGKCGSCSAEVNGKPRLMCMTRMNLFQPGETITVAPIKTFPIIRDLVTDVSFNFKKAREDSGLQTEAQGTRTARAGCIKRTSIGFRSFTSASSVSSARMSATSSAIMRITRQNFAGPRFFVRLAALEMHPLDSNDRMD